MFPHQSTASQNGKPLLALPLGSILSEKFCKNQELTPNNPLRGWLAVRMNRNMPTGTYERWVEHRKQAGWCHEDSCAPLAINGLFSPLNLKEGMRRPKEGRREVLLSPISRSVSAAALPLIFYWLNTGLCVAGAPVRSSKSEIAQSSSCIFSFYILLKIIF